MARQINNQDALDLLTKLFADAEGDFRDGTAIDAPVPFRDAVDRLFASGTQAYREALVGCLVARILDREIDIRLPATEHGDDSFSGRSLADKVVTPFFQSRSVPVSASPYLSSLRGGARFVDGGEPRIQRDKDGFSALVRSVSIAAVAREDLSWRLLRYLLGEFIRLRESANIKLKRIAKPSLEQLKVIVDSLLETKSGGRMPAYLTTAMFQALGEHYQLEWDVEFQGINVADKFTGAVGDVTVNQGGKIVLGVEITERAVNRARVTITFDNKVSPFALSDYLFVSTARPTEDAIVAARNYTAVGHDMNFVDLQDWLRNLLATIGPSGRTLFQDKLTEQLLTDGVPAELRLAWNEALETAINGSF